MTVRSIHALQTQFIDNPSASPRPGASLRTREAFGNATFSAPLCKWHGADAGARFLHKKDAPGGTSFVGSVRQFTTPRKVTSVSLFTM